MSRLRSTCRAVPVLIVIVALVVAMGPAGFVAPVDATHNCDAGDALVAMFTFTYVNYDKCTQNHVDHIIEQFDAIDATETETEVYDAYVDQKANDENFVDEQASYLQDTRTVAWAKGEAAFFKALDAGKSEAEALDAANASVEAYYTQRQVMTLKQFTVHVTNIWQMVNVTKSTTGVSKQFVDLNMTLEGTSNTADDYWIDGKTQVSATLVNGTSFAYPVLVTNIGSIGVGQNLDPLNVTSDGAILYDSGSGVQFYFYGTYVNAISGQTSQYGVQLADFNERFTEASGHSQMVKDNLHPYLTEVYNATQAGTVNTSDYINPITLASQYATDYNSTGYYSYLTAQMASYGMQVPDLNSTDLMTIQTASATYKGLLMSQSAPPNGTWEVGVTYDANTIQGQQFISTVDQGLVELTGAFSIQSMEGPNGESLNSTTSQTYTFHNGTNVSEYQQMQTDLADLRATIEAMEPTTGGGGAGGSGIFGLTVVEAAVGAAAVGGGLLLLRGGGSGGSTVFGGRD